MNKDVVSIIKELRFKHDKNTNLSFKEGYISALVDVIQKYKGD